MERPAAMNLPVRHAYVSRTPFAVTWPGMVFARPVPRAALVLVPLPMPVRLVVAAKGNAARRTIRQVVMIPLVRNVSAQWTISVVRAGGMLSVRSARLESNAVMQEMMFVLQPAGALPEKRHLISMAYIG